MKVFELRYSTNLSTKKYMIQNLNNQWNYIKGKIVSIGKVGNYNLNSKKENNHMMIQVYDNINRKVAGYIEFVIKGKAHSINEVAFYKEYLGLGLATKIYAFLILKLNYILWSENAQTKGGKSIWDKLAKINGINVFTWDITNNEAISLDKNDLNNDTDLYDSDVEWDKSKYNKLKKEFNWYFSCIKKLKDMKKLSPEILNLQKKMMNVYRRMQELRKEELYVENNITLVACREHK